jgi:hypothetical protein
MGTPIIKFNKAIWENLAETFVPKILIFERYGRSVVFE